jgi:putative membrane protein
MKTLIHWLVSALAILALAYILPGINVPDFFTALVVSLVLGIINTFIRPIILLLTLPLNIFTLGLLTLVIDSLLVMLAAVIVPGFMVANFWWALLFGVLLWLVNIVLKGWDV